MLRNLLNKKLEMRKTDMGMRFSLTVLKMISLSFYFKDAHVFSLSLKD